MDEEVPPPAPLETPPKRRFLTPRWASKRRLLVKEHESFLELCGLELAPETVRKTHSSVEAVRARRSMREWMRGAGWGLAAAIENEASRLKFHERLDFRAVFDDEVFSPTPRTTEFEVTVSLGTLVRQRVTSITVRCGEPCTVRALVEAAADQYARLFGSALPAADDRYVFKAIGRAQYLLHGDWRLVDYEYVTLARRKRTKIALELLRLDEETAAALAPIRSLTKKDARSLAMVSRAPEGDYHHHQHQRRHHQDEEEEESMFTKKWGPRLDAYRLEQEKLWASLPSLFSAEEYHEEDDPGFGFAPKLSIAAEPVPLRVAIRRFRIGKEALKLVAGASVRVQVHLQVFETVAFFGPGKSSRPEPLGNVAKWVPPDSLELCPDLRYAPRDAKLIMTVFALADNKEDRLELASVALPLFDRGVVRSGELQLKLWPAGRRDDWAMVGDNPLDDAGALTVVFENEDGVFLADDTTLEDAIDAATAKIVSEKAILAPSKKVRARSFFECDPPPEGEDSSEESSSEEMASSRHGEEEEMRFETQSELTAAVELARARSAESPDVAFDGSPAAAAAREEEEEEEEDSYIRERRPSKLAHFLVSAKERFRTRRRKLASSPDKHNPRALVFGRRKSQSSSDIIAFSDDEEEIILAAKAAAYSPRRPRRRSEDLSARVAAAVTAAVSKKEASSPPETPKFRASLEPDEPRFAESGGGGDDDEPTRERRVSMRSIVESVARRQPLAPSSPEDRDALWREREHASRFPGLLPAWWLAVPKGDLDALKEARALVATWARRDDEASLRRRFKPRQQLHRTISGSTTACTPTSHDYVPGWPGQNSSSSNKARRHPPVPKDALSTHARVALELLGYRHADRVLRAYACRRLDEMRDDHLLDVLPQLVQALKLELEHDAPLARLLVRRGACSPFVLGHRLFWLLRSEMHAPGVCERYGVVLAAFLSACGQELRDELVAECKVDAVLGEVARKLKAESLKTARHKARGFLIQADRDLRRYMDERRASEPPPPSPHPEQQQQHHHHHHHKKSFLANVFGSAAKHHPSAAGISTCLDPTFRCRGIDVSKCRVLSSKKQPLSVVLKNADPAGDDFPIIYKHGDDLRQDQLTLQLVRLMDDLWRRQGLDLQMWPYRCVASGDACGVIEVVREASTTADIQVQFGRGARGAFKDNVVSLYLENHNVDVRSFERARSTFVSSCSGYCVATHVLGVGDRHADNIMVTTTGRLFHIDFGHFLGNFKSKFGIRRERSPFVFTPDMKNVMSVTPEPYERQRRLLAQIVKASAPATNNLPKLGYRDFENFCCDAYNALRDRSANFVVLFTLMLPAGMPELLEPDDITYMIDQLALDLSPAKAAEKFRADIKNAHRDIWRRVDNYFHNRKHAPKHA
ncbi:hypothetical protein CTAYLR_007947 [Chrysophaeum taylorii]|uniref:Phosphatidylinositol 3-kinase n=1 Tax=Chrysophaeum taylorii TaxID=2483200 RepID=A0AAD7UM64_9STRA|nr:hypothetical protein CTAYLR_007947 [Chrysophaeum taylorii]